MDQRLTLPNPLGIYHLKKPLECVVRKEVEVLDKNSCYTTYDCDFSETTGPNGLGVVTVASLDDLTSVVVFLFNSVANTDEELTPGAQRLGEALRTLLIDH